MTPFKLRLDILKVIKYGIKYALSQLYKNQNWFINNSLPVEIALTLHNVIKKQTNNFILQKKIIKIWDIDVEVISCWSWNWNKEPL